MRGELRGDVARAIAVSRLLALADRLVELAPPPGRDPLVQRVPVQRVHERVAGRHRSVRPLARAERAQEELAPHELVAALLHVRHRLLHRRRHRDRRELHARHAARLEHVLLLLADATDLPIDHLAKALGHVQVDRVERGAKLPSVLARRDEAAREQIIDQRHHEQRIALGARVDDVRKLSGERVAREPLAKVVGDRRRAEQRQCQALGPPPRLELARELEDGALGQGGLDGAIGGDQEQPSGLPPPGDQREQVHGRRVAPVEILENEDEGGVGGQRLDQLRHLAQHALSRGPDELALQRVPVARVEEPRHFHEPGGRVSTQERDEPIGRASAAEPGERVQHREIRLARAVRLDALPLRNPHARIGRHALEEGIDDRRLAHARLTRQERDLASASPRRVEPHLQTIQGAITADEMAGAFGSHVTSGRRIRGRERRGLVAGPSLLSAIGDTGDEPVSEAMHGGDVPGRAGRIPEGLADLPHTDLQHGIADHRRRPDRFEEGVLGDELTGALDEVLEHRECLRGEADGFRAPPQARVDRVQPERGEAKQPSGFRFPRHGLTGLLPMPYFSRCPDAHRQHYTSARAVERTDSLRSSLDFSFPRTGRGWSGIYGVSHYRNLTSSSCL